MNRPHLEGCPNIDCHNNKDCCPFRKIVIPSVMGGDSEGEDYAPENGAYRNALVEYESNGHIYMYSSDGIPTRLTSESGVSDYEALTNKPSINGHELIGNKTAEELGITSEPLYVYCKSSPNPYIYKDRECTEPITAGEVLSAYESGVKVVLASIHPEQPTPGVPYSAVYNEVTRVYESRVGGEDHPQNSIFFVINNAQVSTNTSLGWQMLYKASSPSDTRLNGTTFQAQQKLTAGNGITISGTTISTTGGGSATMFYADLLNVQSTLNIYADAHQSESVNSTAMIAALSRGPVSIQDANDNNIYVTVVSGDGSSGPLNIVIDMYDDQGNPARRRFQYEDPDWAENPF